MNTNKRAADVIRALMTVTSTGRQLFSDRTNFGRSIKVWGWTPEIYQTAIVVLGRYGYNAELVRVRSRKRPVEKQTLRLHIRAKAV